jgi:hypothetical protein
MTFRKQPLLVAGFNQDEVEKMDLSSINDEELQETVRKKLLGVETSDYVKQKVVKINDVENYLPQGWEYRQLTHTLLLPWKKNS